MLTECIAVAISRHTGVISRRVKGKKVLHCTQKMNLKFYQHLTLHVITPVWPQKTDATYPVSIVLGVFVLAIFIST